MNLNCKPRYGHPDKRNRDRGDVSAPAFTQDWRCQDCGKLLGKGNGSQMHIRRKPAEFLASFPITAKCPGCGSLNVKNKT